MPKFQQPNFTQQEEIENGKNPKFWGFLDRIVAANKRDQLNEEFLEFNQGWNTNKNSKEIRRRIGTSNNKENKLNSKEWKKSPKNPCIPERIHKFLQTALIFPPKNIDGKKKVEDGSHNQRLLKQLLKKTQERNLGENSKKTLLSTNLNFKNKSKCIVQRVADHAFK